MEDEKSWLYVLVSTLLSGSGIFGYIMAYRERKITLRTQQAGSLLAELGTVSKFQEMYKAFVTDFEEQKKLSDEREAAYKFDLGQLKQEMEMLRLIIKKQNERCNGCPNANKIIRNRKPKRR